MNWLDSIKSVISTPREDERAPDAEYEAIAGEDGDELVRSTGSLLPREPSSDKAVYLAFWALGAGVLLSWNALICTFPLMTSFFAEGSSTRTNLASYLGTVYCLGNFLCLGLAQRDVSTTPPSRRLHLALILLLVTSLLLTFPVLPVLAGAGAHDTITLITLIIMTTLLSISTAYLQSAVFALASLWGSKQVLAVMSGQGGIAVLVSGAQVIMALITTLNSSDKASTQSVPAALGLWAMSSAGAYGCMAAHRYLLRHPDYAFVVAPVLARRDQADTHPKGFSNDGISKAVFKKNLKLEAAVAIVFIVTLSLFPPVTSTIVSVRNPPPKLLQASFFIPLHFLIFNIGDYIGRTYMPVIPTFMITNPQMILTMSLMRIAYLELFSLCNLNPAGGYVPLINSDTAYFLILLSCGLTNGWISSLSMIVASSPALNPNISDSEKDVAGTLAAFCLVGGLLGGSLMSFAVNWMARGNPFSAG